MTSFVTTVNESISKGAKTQSVQQPLTELKQVEEALKRLDGKARSELVLEGPDDTIMIIGGGDGQRYVVSIAVNVDEELFELQRSNGAEQPTQQQVPLVTGGQLGSYDWNRVVDLATATRAAVSFARDGKPDPGLQWLRG